MAKLNTIAGIDVANMEALASAGIDSTTALLESAGPKKGRKELAAKMGVDEKTILAWLNRADLARVKGISLKYSDLLEKAGVDTVPELAQRKPANLHQKLVEVNEVENIVGRLPRLDEVEKWVAQAKELPRAIEYK